ncbi:RNA-directed DNA polymerase [Paenibacillus silviterrae]|uniref:RNA-directed DNA polymerase n=1 Tax=Paenibacillus silviterrae TaxID=3242194 RepID=UPI0025432EC2|nr:RNA-directed DNA polymerase [Paenibacillus chinjuensis]
MQGKLEDIIKKGYFPAELPPPFSTEMLVHFLPSIRKLLDKLEERQSCSVRYSIPKRGEDRRDVYIPNPRQQIQLSRAVAVMLPYYNLNNKKESNFMSLSTVMEARTRALKTKSSFSELQIQRVLLSTESQFLLQLDIEKFYESITIGKISEMLTKYPHKELKNKKLKLDQLPNLLMNTNSRREQGLTVGPDTSLLIAEMLAEEIDEKIICEIPNVKGIRYIDDFYFYLKDREAAETLVQKVKEILDSFHLSINPFKTKIIPLPERILSSWSSKFKKFDEAKSNVYEQKFELLRYFSDLADLFHQHPEESVTKFGVSKISKVYIHRENWDLYEAFLLRCALADPRALPIICRILFTYADKFDYNLDISKISDTMSQIVIKYSLEGAGFEVAWALWTCLSLSIEVNNIASEPLAQMDDPIVALLALDLVEQGLLPDCASLKRRWENKMTEDALYGPYWILVYEAAVKGWLTTSFDQVQKDPFFGMLLKWEISFYDREPTEYYLGIEAVELDEDQAGLDDLMFFEY